MRTRYARLRWEKLEALCDWATLSADCYLLRSHVTDWTDEELWKAYIQSTEAEVAFRIHKSDLSLRPIWHQKERAHPTFGHLLSEGKGNAVSDGRFTSPSRVGINSKPGWRVESAWLTKPLQRPEGFETTPKVRESPVIPQLKMCVVKTCMPR